MKILVTGSEGNIGKKLIPYLKQCKHEVFGCDIIPKFADDYILCSICNVADLTKVFKEFEPEVVINLAAMYGRITAEKSRAYTVDVNISGMNNVLTLCREFNAKFIYFSTSEVYWPDGGIKKEDSDCNPNNIYGLTKYLGEGLVKYEVKNYGLKAAIVRPFTIYDQDEEMGIHRSAIIRFAESLYKKQKIEVHLNSTRSWMHISDAVVAIERVLHLDSFEIINIGTNETIETKTIAQIMCNKLGLKYEDYVKEIPQPEKMSLTKVPDLTKMTELLKIKNLMPITEGIDLVIDKIKKRLNDGN